MRIVVVKFGGSSVATPERIKRVAARIVQTKAEGVSVVAVVSAMGDTTDELLALARQVTDRPPTRELDMLLATGEQQSIALLAMAIQALGEPVISLTGAQGGITTDSVHTKAKIESINGERILEELERGRIVIVAGFQGITRDEEITTLGRGGSDTTAVALAAALKAERCEIFTDVDGVYTADPRLVPSASKLAAISYGEMLEMASSGAVVLQPRAVELAAQYGVVLEVRSSFNGSRGTLVREASEMLEKEMYVSGVTHDCNVAKVVLIDVPDRPGGAHRVFSALARERINVDMIVQSTKAEKTTDLLFTVSRDDLQRTAEVVEEVSKELGAKGVLTDLSVAKVSVVGAGMVSNPGVAALMFEALAERGINIQVISTSEIRISCLIEAERIGEAANAIHAKFGLDRLAQGEAVDLR
ncbi:MAG TPA: aspartate kinase [Firmicutes bacterium]|nr:aspartate kinase [Bacillota bacterium]